MLTDRYPSNIGPLWDGEYEAVRLKDVDVSSLVSKKLCDPYVMGYIPTEKYPGNFFFNVTSLSSNQRSITFNNILTKRNIGWGFAIVGTYSSGSPNMLAITNSSTLYNTSSTPNNDCIVLMNKVQMAKMCARATQIWCTLNGLYMPIADEPSDDAVFFQNTDNRWATITLYINISDYKAMMESAGSENPSRFRFSLNIGGVNRFFNICDDDFNDYNIAKLHDENDEYALYCTISYFKVNDDRSYYGYSGTYAEPRCTPFYRLPLTEDNTENLNTNICACFMPFYGYSSHDWRFHYHTDTDTLSIGSRSTAWNFAGYDIGNFPYTIDLDELQSIPSFNYNHDGIVYGKYLVNQKGYGSGYWSFSIIRQNRFSDGWKQYALYHKSFVNGETYSASDYPRYNGKFEVSLFDENDTPLLTREPTLSTYPEMYDKLRPWQKLNADITVDDFDPADIPEWEPPEPEDDERSFGVDYEPNKAYSIGTLGGFITQYAMTQNQIAQFGHYLWAAFDDSDFWDSISVILPESLSLNPSDILKYIISVRMFPFRLAGMPSFSPGSDSKIYIGRGFKPIDINTQMNVGTIDSYTEDIDGGYADIPAFHGDFRDYEPCARAIVTIPFCGSLELVPSQIIGARIHLRYGVDYSTGAVQATVTVENGTNYIAGILNGSIGATVQMTASNLSQVLQGGIKAGAEIVKTTALIAATGAVEGAEVAAGEEASMSTELASRIPSSGANSINSILSLDSVPPQQISMSNGFASMQVTKANVRLEFRHYTKPSNYAHTHGYACDKTVTLGSLEGKGFTVCKNVDLTGIPATQDELAAIETLLQSGVYL